MDILLSRPIQTSVLANVLKRSFVGPDLEIRVVAPISSDIGPHTLCFSTKSVFEATHDFVLLSDAHQETADRFSWIQTPRPRLDFVRALRWLEKTIGFERSKLQTNIHPTVECRGSNSIEHGVSIGAGTIIESGVKIGAGTQIGKDCYIKSGAVIGEAGFGFERDEEGVPLRMPHLGNVVLGDRVEIGSCTTVCRGTLSTTIVEDDVKIDDHVHVAHNCHIKKRALVVACAELSGSVIIEEEAWIGPNASILEHVRIGRRAFVGLGSVVLRDVADDVTVVGNPARVLERKKSA